MAKNKSLSDLVKDLNLLADEAAEKGSAIACEVAIAMTGVLAYRTPVDTSKALSNWIVTVGKPTNEKIQPYFKGKSGSTQAQSAAETVANARLALESKRPGQSIFISNNQPYIKKLNDGGHSQQPGGFVEAAMLVGNKTLESLKGK